jgi:asparagine synthase (glutamine-hydrolysing)
MCGFVGLFLPRSSSPRNFDIDAALKVMGHRGPDGIATYKSSDGCYSVGFCRLAIIDLETGDQPIVEPNDQRVLVSNGEIYNYLELRRQFPDYSFQTKGDAETLLPLATRYKDDFVHHLNGMYALALYEKEPHQLTLVRDRLGVKPLYWAKVSNGGIVFASEIKALLATGLIKASINENAVNEYLSYGYVPSPQTLFANIQKLPPAHSLVVNASGDISIKCYWQPSQTARLPSDKAGLEKHLLDLLEESVRLQMRSDVPVGALLSGGIDSGLLVALAARHSSKPINTFTVSFEGAAVDEAPLARLVAERYGTNHTEATVSADSIQDEIVNLAWYSEEPLNDAALLPNYLIEKILSEDVTVALNGTGGDELFAGYGRYFQTPIEQRYLNLPGWLRRHILEPTTRIVNPMNAWRLSRADLFDDDRGAYLQAHSTHFPAPIRTLIGNRMAIPPAAQSAIFREALGRFNGDRQSAALCADISTYLPEDLLTLLDRTSMAVSVEGRVPFLDHRFVEAALSVPEKLRSPENHPKALERSMAKDLLPEEIINAPKQGFASPVPHWMKNGLAGGARRLLTRKETLERGWWTANGIDKMMAKPDQHGFRIYSLIMLELAIQIFIENPLGLDAPNVNFEEYVSAL